MDLKKLNHKNVDPIKFEPKIFQLKNLEPKKIEPIQLEPPNFLKMLISALLNTID